MLMVFLLFRIGINYMCYVKPMCNFCTFEYQNETKYLKFQNYENRNLHQKRKFKKNGFIS